MEAQFNPATVAELLSITREMLGDERDRGQGLDAKSATLAGFTGTVLALTTTLGAQLLDLDLGSFGTPLFQCLYIISVVALGTAALIALVGVLRPQPRIAVTIEAIRGFSEYPLIAQPTVEVHGMMINTSTTASRGSPGRRPRASRSASLASPRKR
jgi:hypothetical protein